MVRLRRRPVGSADRPIDTSFRRMYVAVLSRAIARDLFDGQALAKTMASITIATAAAPGFSPLVGSALDHLFGWRSEFAFVAVFAICAGAAYVDVRRRNQGRLRQFPASAQDCRLLSRPVSRRAVCRAGQDRESSDGRLVRGFLGRAARASRRFWLSPVTLGLLFAGVVFLVFGAGMLAPRLSARFGSLMRRWLGWDWLRSEVLRCLWSEREDALLPFLVTVSIFLFGGQWRVRCRARPRYRLLATRPGSRRPCSASRKWRGRHAACRSQRSFQRSGHRAWSRVGADISSSRWSCIDGKGGRHSPQDEPHGILQSYDAAQAAP